MSTGERIRKFREAKHMRQSDLAELLGNDGNTISRWEHNKIGIGSTYIMKLAEIFNTTAEYLLCKTDDPAPQTIHIQLNEPPAQERSVFERNRGTLTYTFKNGERLELPDTDKGYALFEKILMQKAVMA
ncbi:MAG: helix-turn-helix transcriptional regulator [Synergistaceae bacterium]|nr:helix-turn-helix transcriptional regulator [Synergistaceae bacterium]